MALIPEDTYPAQVATDANYPYGKARNETTPADGTGTPFEEQLVNDWLGFYQGLLTAAGITPSGLPDNATTSDYRDAIIYLIKNTTFDSGARVEGLSGLSLAALPTIDTLVVSRVQALTALSGLDAEENHIGGILAESRWRFRNSTLSLNQRNAAAPNAVIAIPLTNLVDNSNLVSVTVLSSAPDYAAHPALAYRPTYEVKYASEAGVVSVSPIVTDAALNLTDWKAKHSTTITLSTSQYAVDETGAPKAFYLVVTGVGLTGFEAITNGFQINRVVATFSTTKLSPGG
jgi:hypothetical protein